MARSKLAELKIIFSYPTSEDWGWFIEQSDGNRELWICCNGQYDGNALTWSFYLKEQIGLFGRSKYTKDEIQKLEETIVKLIRDNGMVITEENE